MGDEMITLDDAAKTLGVHRGTVIRRIAAGELPAYTGADRRRRWVRRTDVDRLREIRPVSRVRRPQAATSATAS